MVQWWELSLADVESDPDMRAEMQLACYETFYASTHGRDVLIFLARLCYEDQNDPSASLALIDLYNKIKGCCGVDIAVERAALDAEASAIEGDSNAS